MINGNSGTISATAVSALQTVLDLDLTRVAVPMLSAKVLWSSFVVGTANLSAFEVQYKVHPNGDYFTVASSSTDYASTIGVLTGVVLGTSGNLAAASSGTTVHFIRLDVAGVYGVRLRAAGTSSSITGHWSVD